MRSRRAEKPKRLVDWDETLTAAEAKMVSSRRRKERHGLGAESRMSWVCDLGRDRIVSASLLHCGSPGQDCDCDSHCPPLGEDLPLAYRLTNRFPSIKNRSGQSAQCVIPTLGVTATSMAGSLPRPRTCSALLVRSAPFCLR